ncbi:MAG: ddlA [Candidatus Nomurabacteria bacterium]|nr:ddlA [Candidatus Nomurabacteria bacterium]
MQRIGILRGGVSEEYDLSLKTGANVQRALHDAGLEAVDMLLDKEGVLHIKGIPADMEDAKQSVDKVWNALHGSFGEDGQIQALLDINAIPYTGAPFQTAELAFDKQRAKNHAKALGIDTPQSILIIPEGNESVSEVSQRIYKTMAPPWVLKPLSGGASLRTYFAFTPLDLAQFVEESIHNHEPFLAEQYIYGREAAVGVIDHFRNQETYALPVVEVQSPSRGILSNEMRNGEEDYARLHGGFSADERDTLSELAKRLHKHFGAKDYSQSEFIVDKRGKPWFIELDTHPHLTNNAPFLVALDAVGATLQEFVKSVVEEK